MLLPLAVALPAATAAAETVGDAGAFPAGIAAPTGVALGPDGRVWYAGYGSNAIGAMTAAGAVTAFPVPTPGATPYAIADGGGTDLWFTESFANKIGRITTSGVLTEFSLPTIGGQPLGIAKGPDGAFWFAESGANQIGRIATSGVVTEFLLPTPGARPNAIAVGPDGNLWFTEGQADRIGRITTAGVVTEFSVPTAGAQPFGIAAGPDGNLWFTELVAGKVGRITPSGIVTEFDLPSVGAAPAGIVAGPDGNVWFAESAIAKIGRITTGGAVTEYATPGPLRDLAAGGDVIWGTGPTANAITRVFAGVPAATLDASTVDFGPVTANTTAQRTVTVRNTGTGDLVIPSVDVSGPDADEISLDAGTTCADATVLAPDASCDVVLDLAAGATPGPRSATLTIADTASGSPRSIPLTATVTLPPPSAATGAATDVGRDGAVLAGLATPNGVATSVRFEYGTTDAYGSVTPAQDVGDGADGVAVHAALHGLTAGTTYHFRLIASSASGTTFGADGTFTSAPAAVEEPAETPAAPAPAPAPAPVAPVAPLALTARPAAVLAGHSARIAFTSPTGRSECRVDDGPWIPCASPFAIDRLVAGDHVLSVRALDAAGTPVGEVAQTRFQINPNAPTVSVLGGRTLTADAARVVAVRVRCSPREGGGRGACAGTVALRWRGGTALGRAAAFRAAAGRTATVAIKLPAAALRRLPKHGPGARVTVAIDAKDLAGNRRRASVARTLRRHR
ncbi:MAG TPA: choice-of-anchor D domain-containing protein [Baekduia sp.]|uniref:virginiamycin B lyase family protein n=1 Tax=Baekduia sp. TaxID=2600305 RepID=UPI002D76D8DD|nr:choice-of-anchor D domain-containing protein [Baekduia sp.]HET6508564.1 choice-of-anchor D domain-containing protein [Baekduia sp.]